MSRKNQHVTPRPTGWAVIGEGNERASSRHQTQRQAIEAGQQRAMQEGSELLIHGRNGQIRARNSYGKDPYPPKG